MNLEPFTINNLVGHLNNTFVNMDQILKKTISN